MEDLKDIRHIMNRSSRFISLSGLSGILVGCIAIIGAFVVHRLVFDQLSLDDYKIALSSNDLSQLFIVAISTLLLSILSVVLLTTYETRKKGQKIWDFQSKRLLINLAIPLATGGIICLILLFDGFAGLMAPFTLIFYGLSLVNASKYTLDQIRSLGIIEILLGLMALLFINNSLIIWTIGFGGMHILYGIIMHLKSKL